MNDPRSSNGRGGAAKQATTTVSDLGTKPGEWKDLGEVSRGQQDISKHPPASSGHNPRVSDGHEGRTLHVSPCTPF